MWNGLKHKKDENDVVIFFQNIDTLKQGTILLF